MAKAPPTSTRASERREQLLQTAIALFDEHDYDDVSVDDIAKAAGVSHGLLFQYFGSKQELYVATVQPIIEEFRRRIAPDPELPPPERLRGTLRAYADFIHEHPTGYRSLMTRASRVPEVRGMIEEARWVGVHRIASQIGLDAERPEVRIGLRAWIGYMDTAMLAWIDNDELERDDLVEMIALAMRSTLESIAAAAD
ncbi:MAG: TetR/AcrR family transcriptional regulator [Solirubrobacterales bacterium]|nr:TetR/AcrR family transcriptional regulator [Solirubrobacterales bacterium]